MRGNREKALEYYLKAEEIDPNHVNTQGNLGLYYLKTGDLLNAEKHLKQAAELVKEYRHRRWLILYAQFLRVHLQKHETVYNEWYEIFEIMRRQNEPDIMDTNSKVLMGIFTGSTVSEENPSTRESPSIKEK